MASKKVVKKKTSKKVSRRSSVNSTSSKSSNKKYGGFWIRFLATILDGLIIGVAVSLLTFGNRYGGMLTLVLGWLYFALMESSNLQATLGKLAFGLKVTGIGGNQISFGRATGRYFAKYISIMILCIGFIMIAFTEKKQGLHDLIADTLVVWK